VRDGGRCVYCGGTATSIDHVVPRSRGGRHEWGNVVSACRRCNHVKADRTVADLGWRLHPPEEPTGTAWRILGTGRSDPRWVPYLEAYGGGEVAGAATA
jgi:5-methylcytosine-specific restriction endonuclease McrA